MPVNSSLSLDKRIAKIPDAILNVWKQADKAMNPQADLYKSYTLSAAEQQQFAQAIAKLPTSWQQVMQQKVSRFFFIDQLLGGGITDWVVDAQGERVYTMILNPALFKASAQEWLEMRENSSFAEGPFHLSLNGFENISALQYILWHEAAHLIDFETQQTPVNDVLLRKHFGFDKNVTAFTKNVWKARETAVPQPLSDFDFPARKNINPYRMNIHQTQIDNSVLKQSFMDWKKTPFTTIYASSTWAEDFADFAAFTLAAKLTGKSPQWLLKDNGKTIGQHTPLVHPINKQRLI